MTCLLNWEPAPRYPYLAKALRSHAIGAAGRTAASIAPLTSLDTGDHLGARKDNVYLVSHA
jgi:hypothetical protein